jgi:Uma2 family endonuclease
MAESDIHRILMVSVIERLGARFASRTDVYVSGNLMVYYAEGQPKKFLAPDCFVVFGVRSGPREIYQSWAEGKLPDVVFEFTSKTTHDEDLKDKFQVYQNVWRVKEYFLFDPRDEYLKPPLRGYRLQRGELRPMKLTNGVLTSKVLGITLARDGTRLLLRDATTGHELLTAAEQQAATAEAEIARLKAELAALRRGANPT